MGLTEDAAGILVITFLFCAMLCGFIAFSKDRSWLGFALAGLLLGPLGLIVTGIAEPGDQILRGSGEEPPSAVEPFRLDIDKS